MFGLLRHSSPQKTRFLRSCTEHFVRGCSVPPHLCFVLGRAIRYAVFDRTDKKLSLYVEPACAVVATFDVRIGTGTDKGIVPATELVGVGAPPTESPVATPAGSGDSRKGKSGDKDKGKGASNRGRHSDARVDALLDQALATVDDAKRAALLAETTDIAIGENQGIIPLHYQVNTWATRKGLKYNPRADERTTGIDLVPAN